MLTPIILATWISVCLPQADPVLAHALVAAGSEGEPLIVMDADGQKLPGSKAPELVAAMKTTPADKELYVGLVQIPRSSLKSLGIPDDLALDPCINLQVGYQLYSAARDFAGTVEKTPKKMLGMSFNYFRTRQKLVDGPYAQKAVAAVDAPKLVSPAPFGTRLYMGIAAQAAASNARLMALGAIALHQSGGATSRAAVVRLSSLY